MSQDWTNNTPNQSNVALTDISNMQLMFESLRSSFSGTTEPTSAVEGQLFYNTSSGQLYFYDGSSFSAVTGTPETAITFTPTEDSSWTAKTSVPVAVYGAGAVYYNQKIYFFGGTDGTTDNKTMYEYDVATDTWTTKATATYTMNYCVYALINGKIYILGGGPDYKHQMYDISADTFTDKAAYPIASCQYQAGEGVDNLFYVFGGYDGTNRFADLYAYDYSTDSWTAKTSMPTARDLQVSATIGQYIYAFAGRDSGGTLSATSYRYSIENDSWSSITNYPLTIQVGDAKTISKRKILCAGGSDGSSNMANCYYYDVITDSYTATIDLAPVVRLNTLVFDTDNYNAYNMTGITSAAVADNYIRKINFYKEISLSSGEALVISESIGDNNSYHNIFTDDNFYGDQLSFAAESAVHYVETDGKISITKISK